MPFTDGFIAARGKARPRSFVSEDTSRRSNAATVRSPDSTWRVDPRDYLLEHRVTKLVNGHDLILQLARHVADDFRRRRHQDIEVYATALASLNGRKPQLLIDPTVNLASQREL